MTLRQLIGAIAGLRTELTVFNAVEPERLRGRLATYFRTQNVQVRTERTPSGRPAEVAVLSDDTRKTALLAGDHGDGRFDGVRTYDPGIVDAALARLERRYTGGTRPRSAS
jgi:hypothetical protein